MKISIIIPIYNVASYIRRCLDSVAAQTYTGDIECILVDDCGKDDSMTIARQWIKNYSGRISFVILSHTHNQGLSAARNTGIEAASGDYIYFLDSDDAITPDCIEILTNLAAKYPDANMIQGNTVVTENGTTVHNTFRTQIPEIVSGRQEVDHAVLSSTLCTAWNRLLKKSFILQHHLFFPPGKVHEDICWLFFLCKQLTQAVFTNTGTYYYYVNAGSIMTDSSEKNISRRVEGYRTSVDSYLKDMLQYGSTSKYQRQFVADILLNYLEYICTCNRTSQWLNFWGHIMTLSVKARRKTSPYRILLFLCLVPPICFFVQSRWWRWRIRHYIISRV